jgi:Arc/MetJ-type ribon-helix-helix transcriptional regulator
MSVRKTVRLTEQQAEHLALLDEAGEALNESEVIRSALREYLQEQVDAVELRRRLRAREEAVSGLQTGDS